MAQDTATRRLVPIRFLPEQLEQVDAAAARAGLSRNDYVVRCALGKLVEPEAAVARIGALEQRMLRLEQVGFGGLD